MTLNDLVYKKKKASPGPSLAPGRGPPDDEAAPPVLRSSSSTKRSHRRRKKRAAARRAARSTDEECISLEEESPQQRVGAYRVDGPVSSSPSSAPLSTRNSSAQEEQRATSNDGIVELEAHLVDERVLASATPAAKWKKYAILGLVLLLLAVISVLLGVFVVLNGGSSSSNGDTRNNLQTEAPTIINNSETDNTDGSPTDAPATATLPPTSAADRVENLISRFTSTDTSLLQDETSPQGQAYQWIKGDTSSGQGTFSDDQILDRYALAVLYYGTSGNSWSPSSSFDFLLPLSHCEWYGVTCDSSNRPVILTLSSQDLQGALPPEIGLLTSLTVLDLKENLLTGSMPSEIGLLTNMKALDLSGEDGPRTLLPPLSSRFLQADSNMIKGSIPSEIGSLTKLEELKLSGNSLGGRIPSEIGSLTALSLLALDHNALTGALPLQLGFLTNLVTLSVDRNNLTGQVPNVLCSYVSLLQEAASDCLSSDTDDASPEVQCGCCNICCSGRSQNVCVDLTATVSPTISPVPSMSPSLFPSSSPSSSPSTPSPSDSPTSGPTPNPTSPRPTPNPTTPRPTSTPTKRPSPNPTPLPTPAPTQDRFEAAFSDMLAFAQTISSSSSLSNPSSPQYKAVEWLAQDKVDNDSNWSGYELIQRYVLRVLYHSTDGESWTRTPASTAWFIGGSSVCQWPEVGLRGLYCNRNGQQVDEIHLFDNDLQGTIPAELGELTALTYLELSRNALTGTIPFQLGQQLTSLTKLSLSENQLTGSIPSTIGDLAPALNTLYLWSNRLTGTIPPQLGLLTGLTGLSLQSNQLTGSIPSALTRLVYLTDVFFHNNRLTGSVPSAFCAGPFPDWRNVYGAPSSLRADCMSGVQCGCCDVCYYENSNVPYCWNGMYGSWYSVTAC